MDSSKRMNFLILGIIAISVLSASYYLFVNVGQDASSPDGDESEEVQEINIGVLADYETSIPRYSLISAYAEEKINEYCNASGLLYVFHFIVDDAQGQTAGALERVQSWKTEGVNLVAGPPWSSMFCPTRQFADQNEMIVMSHESTSPVLSMDDHGYRLTIHDWKEVQLIQILFEESHVEAVVCLSRSDSWGDGILVELSEKWDGELVTMSYRGEVTSFLGELQWVEETVSSLIDRHGEGHVAVLALSFTEMATILNQSRAFPALQRVPWYGPGFVNDDWPAEIGIIAASLNLTSFAPLMPESTALEELNSFYRDTFGEDIGYYEANLYDVCWILSLSVLEAGSDNASAMRSVIPDVAAVYPGVTGNCTLDQYGDRDVALFGIYRYEVVDGELRWSLTDEYLIDFQEVFNREGVH